MVSISNMDGQMNWHIHDGNNRIIEASPFLVVLLCEMTKKHLPFLVIIPNLPAMVDSLAFGNYIGFILVSQNYMKGL